jgi:hypothetical protein
MYGGTGGAVGRSVVAAGDGYVVAGTINSSEGRRQIYLLKTDLKGNLAWEKSYDGADARVSSLIAAGDGYVVSGCALAAGSGEGSVRLLKADGQGNVVWDRTFGPDVSGGEAPAIAVRNGYVVAGTALSQGSGQVSLWKTATDGNPVQEKTLGGTGSCSVYALASVPTGYVVTGSVAGQGLAGKDLFLEQVTTGGPSDYVTTRPVSSPAPSPAIAFVLLAFLAGALAAATSKR